MSARDEVLSRIRDAIGPGQSGGDIPRGYRTTGSHAPGSPELLDLLSDRLEDYRASVRRCTARTLAATVTTAVAERGARRVGVAPGLLPELAEALAAVEVVTDDPPLNSAALDSLDGVVTGCAIAIAETGTFVLDGTPLCGRRALTLVPDYHLVVVRSEDVVESVPEGIARLDPLAPLTWVSGPSATSDIELSRVEGVHGPRTLEVILVD